MRRGILCSDSVSSTDGSLCHTGGSDRVFDFEGKNRFSLTNTNDNRDDRGGVNEGVANFGTGPDNLVDDWHVNCVGGGVETV